MPRTVVYRAGGFTNCGIGYTKFSQEELAERRDRAMTENEALEALKLEGGLEITGRPIRVAQFFEGIEVAIKALEEVRQYRAIGTPEELKAAMKYVYLAKKHGTVGQVIENCVKYEEIGTPEECRAAMEKQNANKELESHDEKHILECCISLMKEMVNEFAEWYRWQHGEDAIEELDEEERFCFKKSYFRIVQELFLLGTNHSGGTSTKAKCEQLGVDSSEEIEFDWRNEE